MAGGVAECLAWEFGTYGMWDLRILDNGDVVWEDGDAITMDEDEEFMLKS